MKKSIALFAVLAILNLVIGTACTKVENETPATVGHTTTTTEQSHSIRAY